MLCEFSLYLCQRNTLQSLWRALTCKCRPARSAPHRCRARHLHLRKLWILPSAVFRSCRLHAAPCTKAWTKVPAEIVSGTLQASYCRLRSGFRKTPAYMHLAPAAGIINCLAAAISNRPVYIHSCLLAVPFTPTQGICTPSPTNMAAYWYQLHYGFPDPFAMYASAWSPVSITSCKPLTLCCFDVEHTKHFQREHVIDSAS